MFFNSNSSISTNSSGSISRNRWTRRLYRAVTAAVFGALVLGISSVEAEEREPGVFFMRLYGTGRTIEGDHRPFLMTLFGDTLKVGDKFMEGGGGGGFGVGAVTRLTSPFGFGIDLDLTWGGGFVLGGIFSGMYNIPLAENVCYLSLKAGIGYTYAYIGMGKPGYTIWWDFLPMRDPYVTAKAGFLVARPEINLQYRLHDRVFLFAGGGYNFTLNQLNMSYDFDAEGWDAQSLSGKDPAIGLYFDGTVNSSTKTKMAPTGLIINVGVAIDIAK